MFCHRFCRFRKNKQEGAGAPTPETSATGSGRAHPTASAGGQQPPPELPPSEPPTTIDNDNLFELQGIKPVFDPTTSHPSGNRFNMASLMTSPNFDMRKFLHTPMQPGVVFECQIERAKGGLNSFFPKYVMRTDTEDEIVLMKATKQKKNKTSNYHISYCDSRYPGSGSQVDIGKLRSNFLGSEFIAYSWGPDSQGLNPKYTLYVIMISNESIHVTKFSCQHETFFGFGAKHFFSNDAKHFLVPTNIFCFCSSPIFFVKIAN